MAYITTADLQLAIGRELLLRMTDPDNTGAIQEEIVLEAIKAAESKINGYLVKRYAVPVAVPPELVRQLAIDGALYKLKTRGKSMATAEEVADEMTRIELLRDISNGTVMLDVDPGPTASSLSVDKAGPPSAPSPSVSAKKTARDALKGTW